jgi:hypothetical protein
MVTCPIYLVPNMDIMLLMETWRFLINEQRRLGLKGDLHDDTPETIYTNIQI